MDKKLFYVYLILLVAFIVIYPILYYKDALVDHLSTTFSENLNAAMINLKANIKALHRCSAPNKTNKRTLDPNKAKILFVLDDNWGTQYYFAYQVLKRKGFPATIAVIPSKVDQPGYMTKAQLTEVYDAGWDLVNHTFHHPKLNTLNEKEQEQEILRGTDWLNANCFQRGSKILVYPYGAYNQTTLSILKKHRYHGARSLQTGFENNSGYLTYEAKVYNLTTDIETEWVKDWIDQAIEQKKTLIFVNHRFAYHVTHDPTGMIFDKKKFIEVVDYIDQLRSKVEVITYSEWLDNADH